MGVLPRRPSGEHGAPGTTSFGMIASGALDLMRSRAARAASALLVVTTTTVVGAVVV
jgi:hypothetical protein